MSPPLEREGGRPGCNQVAPRISTATQKAVRSASQRTGIRPLSAGDVELLSAIRNLRLGRGVE